MSLPDGLTVRGFVADGDTGEGLGGLRVELWRANGGGPSLAAAARSDAAGTFRLRVPAEALAHHRPGRPGTVEVRVLEGETLLLSELHELASGGGAETIELSVTPAAGEDERATEDREDEGAAERCEVKGRVRAPVPEGTRVHAVLRTPGGDGQVVSEGVVNRAGWYRMAYERPDAGEARESLLTVRLHTPAGERIGESHPVAPARRTRLDVRPDPSWPGPSEYTLLERQVGAAFETGVAGLDGVEESAVAEVSGWLDVDPSRLSLLRRARVLEEETGVPAPVLYALGREGLEIEPEALLEIPRQELRSTLEMAAAEGIVDSGALGELEPLVQRLGEQAIERALRSEATATRPGLATVLAAAGLPAETTAEVLRRYQARTGSASEFWESLGAESSPGEGLDEETVRDVERAVRLGELLGPDPVLLQRAHELRREGRWQEPEDLARLDFDDWCDLLEEVEAGWDVPLEASEEGEGGEDEAAAWIEARAEAILDTLEEAFPSTFIHQRLSQSEDLSAAARQLLAKARGHDLLRESIRDRVAGDPGLLEGLAGEEAEAAMEEVEAVERISRVAEHADDVAFLVGTGMQSALDIASMPRRHFIDLYAEALGGRPQAAQVHAQAQQAAAGTKMASVRMLQAVQHVPFVLGAPPDVKGLPDARTLFQAAGGFCDCEHCASVYSPAAYFVDLLRYLNVAHPDRLAQIEKRLSGPNVLPERKREVMERLRRHQPLEVLLARRPDLADIPLTCENTLTPLPYIDLVNELLEAAITGGSAAFDTGKTPADVLRAVPQNVSREAYARLQQAVHPLTLPYNQPLAVARAYLGHLGVPRLELMRVLGRGEGLREALTAEALGMSAEEFVLVALPPPEPWRHLGFEGPEAGGVPYVQALAHVPALLEAAGITFQVLIDLVSTRFLNLDDQLKLDSPTPDCNPDVIRVTGLDEARLVRMIRMIRLQRRLGWTFDVLDRALIALGATDLEPAVLEKLAAVRELARRLDLPPADLLVLWAPMDTWGKDNAFDRLFTTRAVAWRTQDERTFRLRPDRADLAQTGDGLDPVASALLAAFRITSEDLAAIRQLLSRRGGEPRLDLAGLSAVHRVVVLSRALRLRIPSLDLLLRLVPPDADPFSPRDPAATIRFLDVASEVQGSEFTPERLAYLLRHEWEPRRDPSPLPAHVEAVLASIRRGLADAYAETSRPSELTSDTLRPKLAALLDAGLLDSALEALDPRSAMAAEARREFFDRHLARLFPDAAAAAARLLAAPAAGAPREELEARWRASILFIFDQLLPQLRTRQMRGAVIQALSDTLGLSAPATARLLDGVLRSRQRRGEPLLGDFLALMGTGLTGAYYANADWSGDPAVVRTDPELSFSWAGAPPAEGVPGREFSVRWSGRLLPRGKGPHTFFVQTDGAVRLSLNVDGAERVLIDQPAGGGRAAEHASQPVALDPRQLVEIRLEYRNKGGPASVSLQLGTTPGARQPVPAGHLYPADGLKSFAPVEESYRRLHKAALLLTGFGMTDAQLEWLAGPPSFLDLDTLPAEAGGNAADAATLFGRWRQLAGLFALRKKLPRSSTDLFEVFRAATLGEAVEKLVQATGWDRGTVEAFLGPQGLAIDGPAALRPGPDGEPALLRLARAMEVQRRAGVAPATLREWASSFPDADGAAAVVQAVKARYDENRWLEVARTLNDPLRAERRDALVACLLPRMRAQGIRNRNQLFEYFLIDVDMNPCMLSSRIRQATAAVQTFFQRCLMNLEPKVPPRIIDEGDWKWMKNYRVWEANRKIFLYPENWIEPELRDDKSPLFEVLERTILQQEIKNENVEAAFTDYLQGLDEIARLEVRAVWFEKREGRRPAARLKPKDVRIPTAPWSEWDEGTYHVFARTYNAPHVWYYRRLEGGRTWTPWEKVEADIEGEHLLPVIYQRRMHLFWTQFREVSKPAPSMSRESKGPAPTLGKDWEIHLAYSVYERGRWSRKRVSSTGVLDVGTFVTLPRIKDNPGAIEGTRLLSPSDYTLRARVTRARGLPQLTLYLYSRAVERVLPHGLLLSPTQVRLVTRFALSGCNGALVPEHERAQRPRMDAVALRLGRARVRSRRGAVRPAPVARHASHPFRIATGGTLNAPTGYRVNGMAFTGGPGGRGALLALPSGDERGIAVALARGFGQAASVVPVMDPAQPSPRALYPFFFQDAFRSYFVRPIYSDWKPPRLVAVPVIARRAVPPARPAARKPAAGRRTAPVPRRIAGRGRREELEDIGDALAPEALDAWEDEQDEAWHPDDAAEARRRRRRRRPPQQRPAPARPAPARRGPVPARRAAPMARPVPFVRRFVRRVQPGYHERRLQFTPFEHPDTCRLLATLKASGIPGLLEFSTTRPRRGRDHDLRPDGAWARRPATWFQQQYGAGPLVFARDLPHLDVAFEADHPYAAYNWELFFHAPLQVAVRLAKDGRHEEAQRWFHFIFDPTTDSTSPSPRRYWRFAPFYENNEYDSARELMQLLSYSGRDERTLLRHQQVVKQLLAWWEKPFSPHVIARLRIAAYQKAVVMKYIDNLVEWGDKLFRRDTMESIQEATQIYILAANILGPRPEKIPPIVSKEPLTFRRMRQGLDLFANFEVRLENLQVRRPFRVNARPEVAGAAVVLGMATQYFCTPPNPQLDKYWDTVADRLFKIRNCMNIQGVVRQLPLFDPPIDPALLVRAAAAGVDLGSVIARLNAPPPHYRFRFLLARAIRLADEIRGFGAMTLQALERRDAEALASLRASSESALLEAVRDIRKKQVREVEEALAELTLQREHIEMQARHIDGQLQQLMNPQEEARQKSLSATQVISMVAEGIDLAAKVAYAIPEIQTGAAGAFSSPFATLQLGGQMFGDILAAVASGYEKVMSKNETEAELAAAQAEYQRRREEWQQELALLAKEKAQVDKRIAEAQLKLEIVSAELRRHDLEVENARKVERYLRDKYTNEQLYGWMLGQLATVYFQAYKVAFDAAQQAERAFRFERGEPSTSFIEFSYWDSLKKGLFAGERLLLDLRRMEAAHVEGDRRALEVTRQVSLRDDYPQALVELLATGRCQVDVTEALLDGDFPGHYFRRVKTVSMTMAGTLRPHANVNCTLTLLQSRIRTDPNASGSYAQAADAEDSRFAVNLTPVQAVSTSRPDADHGLFQLRFDDDRYLPFEGAGAISTWRIELHQSDNPLDLGQLSDVVLTLAYTARAGGAPLEAAARAEREKGLARGGLKPDPQHLVSLRRDVPGAWKRLEEAAPGQEVELTLPLEAARFSGRYRGLDLRIERVTVFAHPLRPLEGDALRLRLDPPKGSGTAVGGWAPPWPRARVVRASAEASGPPGVWKVAVAAGTGKVSDVVADLVLMLDLRARKS